MVGDSKGTTDLIINTLERSGYTIHYNRVETKKEFNRAIEKDNWDIILCDYLLPDSLCLEALNTLQKKELDIPFIIMCENTDEDKAIEAMKRGASDYVAKDNLRRLAPAVEREIRDARFRHDRLRIAKELYDAKILLDKTFASLNSAVIVVDSKTRIIITCNPAVTQVFGYEQSEMIGRTTEFLHVNSSEFERFGKESRDALNKHGVYHTEFLLRRKNGEIFHTENMVTEILDNDGNRTAVVSVVRDITERKRVEDALKDSEEKYRTLIEISSDAIFINQNNTITYLNRAALQLFGADSPEQILGKSPLEFFHPDYHARIMERIKYMIAEGKPVPLIEEKIIRIDGTVIDVEVVATPFNYRGEHAIQVVLRDITMRKQAEQQIHFQASLLDQVNNGVLATNTEGKIVYWNKFAEELHGWKKEEVLGRFITDFLVAEGSIIDPEEYIREFQKNGRWSGELILLRKDGTRFPAYVTHTMIRSDDGTMIGTVAVSVDITEQIHVEEVILKSKEQLQLQSAALESAANAFIITDRNGVIEWANPAFLSLSGYDIDEVIGSKPNLLKSGKMSGEFYAELWNTVTAGKVWRGELINKRKDGTLYDEEMTITPVKNAAGKISHFVAVKEDISKQKELQHQLIQTQKLESIGTLASGIAHDFNNILGIILGYSTLLERSRRDDRRFEENIKTIKQAVNRGSNLVQQILTFARKTDVEYNVINLNVIIRELSQMLHETFPRSISIKLNLDKNLPAIIIDQAQVNQALLNLCVNARDAILAKEKPYGTITIRTSYIAGKKLQSKFPEAVPDKYIIISVSDTGAGINESIRDRIFDPFYTTKSPDKGTGLGLSLVYGIVKTYKGFIDMESEAGKGTTFTLYLPVYQEIEEKKPDDKKLDEVIAGGNETLLIVEDEEMLRNVLIQLLENKGYHVITARDGEEGIEKYKEHNEEIALVVTDMGLPKMSGTDLYAALREINPDIKTILASGFVEPGVSSELYKKGIKEIIRKPYDAVEILQKVRNIIDM